MIGSIIGIVASALRDPSLEHFSHLDGERLKSLLYSNTILEIFAAADTFLSATPIIQTREQWLSHIEKPLFYETPNDSGVVRSIPVALFSQGPHIFCGAAYLQEKFDIAPGQNTHEAMATHQAIYWARTGCSKIAIQSQLEEYFQYDMKISFTSQPQPIGHKRRQGYVPDGIDCALEALSFRESIHNAVSISQEEHNPTLLAITGALAESRFGVPRELSQYLARNLPEKMLMLLKRLYMAGQPIRPQINKTALISPLNSCFDF